MIYKKKKSSHFTMTTPGFNIMYEKKISFFQDGARDKLLQHATFLYRA